MKAALWYGKKDVRIQEVEEPQIRPGYVKLKIRCCGICGSDLHEYTAGPIFVSANEPHPLTGQKAPIILGHEFVGDVIEVGPDVKRIKIGDRVAAEWYIKCGQCYHCKRGDYRLCSFIGSNGLSGTTGGFAQYTIAPEYQLYKIPETLSYEEAAFSDPFAVGVHAMTKAEMLPGKKVGIFGVGPIGLCVIQVARASGASLITASEIFQSRRDFARRYGANLILDAAQGNVPEAILEATEGVGLDIAFECAGVQPSFLDAINSTKKGGTIVQIGVYEKPVSLDMSVPYIGEKRIQFSVAYNCDFPAVMALLADGRISIEGMITKKISLSDLVAEGFDELVNNLEKHIKIMVYPD